MIQQIFNMMFIMMMAKFVLNDMPKKLGLLDNPSNPKTKTKTKYRVLLKHKDPIIAAAEERSGIVHEGYAHAYSRDQAKLLVSRRKPGYLAISAYEGNDNPTGTCYEDAAKYVISKGRGVVIHGTAISLGRRLGHAWVELPGDGVWEPYSREVFTKARFQELVDPIEEARYTPEETAIMAIRTGHYGPWQ